MTQVLSFLGLDVGEYPFEQAVDAPIQGSSDLISAQRTEVHWEPIKKSAEFNPLTRWRHWDDHTHCVFNELAGAEMLHVGYELHGSNQDTIAPLPPPQTIKAVPQTPEALIETYLAQPKEPIVTRKYPERQIDPPAWMLNYLAKAAE